MRAAVQRREVPAPKVCTTCSKEFSIRADEYPSEFQRRRYCSRSCRTADTNAKRAAQQAVLKPAAVADLEWQDRAACKGMDLNVFYPKTRGKGVRARVPAVCDRCPVRTECLNDALVRGDRTGIWGGTLPSHRRKMRKPEIEPAAAGEPGVCESDVEDAIRGLPVVLNRDEKRTAARRMYAAGCSKTQISQRLRISGRAVNEFLEGMPSSRGAIKK